MRKMIDYLKELERKILIFTNERKLGEHSQHNLLIASFGSKVSNQ
jgi:hypothetical protein